ncbi:MAG: peptidylprolyl isomerase [Bacteroidota bacterium]
MKYLIKLITLLIVLTFPFHLYSQEKVIDQVVAVVGNNNIKLSDIEMQYSQYQLQNPSEGGAEVKCEILENLLFMKLLLHQAEMDSLVVKDEMVQDRMNRNLRYFISQIGSKEKLEEYYHKSIAEIKEEMFEQIRKQLLSEMMQNKITEKITITPSEVKQFYKNINQDSLPLVESEFQIGQIVKQPVITEGSKTLAKEKINGLYDRIKKGENFAALATLYSDDIESAKKGGELGMFTRGEMLPEFEAAAFTLKAVNDISPVIKTKEGYHVLQLIERRGEYVNARHILIRPKVTEEDLQKAKTSLDSIYLLINNPLKFEDIAIKYSDDPNKYNGGMMINTYSGSTKFLAKEIDQTAFFIVDKLKQGEFSKPVPMQTEDRNQAYRILYLKLRTKPHKANLIDDYDRIQTAALENKKQKAISDWIKDKINLTYITINGDYKKCKFAHTWVK